MSDRLRANTAAFLRRAKTDVAGGRATSRRPSPNGATSGGTFKDHSGGRHPIAIIGAGPTGLSAAYHLQHGGEPYTLVEKEDRVGGLCRSLTREGFTFDYAGHIIFTKSEYVKALYPRLLGDNVHTLQREAWAYWLDTYIGYPFQTNAYGLPPDVQTAFILDAAEAWHVRQKQWAPAKNLAEHGYRSFGDAIAEQLFIPYNFKVWATPPSLIGVSWLGGSGGRVPTVNFKDIVHGAFHPPKKDLGPNAQFQYPLRGGFEALMRGFLPLIDQGRLLLNTPVEHVDWRRKVLVVNGRGDGNGRTEIPYSHLINTMPLRELIRSMDDVPASVQRAASDLLNTTVLCVNVAVGRENVSDKHWIYYPDPEIVFQRIFCMSNASPFVAPRGTSSFICEISTSKFKPVARRGLVERAVRDAIKVKYIRASDDIILAELVELPYAYLVQDVNRDQNLNLIRAWLEEQDIHLAGRFGEWRYINSDEAILAGRDIAERLRPHLAEAPPVCLPESAAAAAR